MSSFTHVLPSSFIKKKEKKRTCGLEESSASQVCLSFTVSACCHSDTIGARKKKEIAFSRDRNRLRVVNDFVAVREGERDIVDIEYRTLQLRIVAQRGAAVRDRLVYKESSSERCLVLQKIVVCCFVSRKSCTHGGKRCSRGTADLAPRKS